MTKFIFLYKYLYLKQIIKHTFLYILFYTEAYNTYLPLWSPGEIFLLRITINYDIIMGWAGGYYKTQILSIQTYYIFR